MEYIIIIYYIAIINEKRSHGFERQQGRIDVKDWKEEREQ